MTANTGRTRIQSLFSCLQTSMIISMLSGVFIISTYPANASGIRIHSTVSSSEVFTGEQITLTIEIVSQDPVDISHPELPELTGLRYLSTLPRTETRYALVDGRARMIYQFQYTLQAVRPGAYQVPPVYVVVSEQEMASQAITIVIRAPDEGDLHRPVAPHSRRPTVYMDMELSETRPVRGQQIVAEVVLYFRNTVEVSTFQVTRSWQTEGFWREDLNSSQTRRSEPAIIDGMPYQRAVLARYALFPTRSGELTLPSYAISLTVRQSGQNRDQYHSFFEGFGRTRNLNLETPPRILTVLSPPAPPEDALLISAFGQFTIHRFLNENRVKLGETVEVITEISGAGNLGLISRPHFDYPDNFDAHRPAEKLTRDPDSPRMAGTKQFRDILIARSAGRFTIPETTLWLYNDASRRYEAHRLPELDLEVIRDPNTRITIAQPDDFRLNPVSGTIRLSQPDPRAFYYHLWFWFAWIIPLFALLWGWSMHRYRKKLIRDDLFSRFEQAHSKALDLLRRASSDKVSQKNAYSLLFQSISGFVSDRTGLSSASIDVEKVVALLNSRNVEAPLVSRAETLLQKCSSIRFMPESENQDRTADLEQARQLLMQLKSQL